MSRIENNKFTIFKGMFDIEEAVKEVFQIMEFQAKQKNLFLKIHIEKNVPKKIETDQKRYKQILYNLIGNATKFTFKGGINVHLWFDQEDLYTEIEDTGIGIVEEDLNTLFKFFGQISNTKDINRGGMGLGLTISKMILQQLSGEISVVSTFKVGSTFTFRIPITNYKNDLVQQFVSEEEIKEIHPNQSFEKENETLQYSVEEELSKDIAELNDDQENSLFKQL